MRIFEFITTEMSHREAEKVLKKHHYHLERTHGGHEIWKDEEGHTFALPHKHHAKDLSKGVEHQLKKEVTHEDTDNDLKDVANWMDTTPDNISVEVKQEPIEKFIKQIREMYGTYNEFPEDEQRTDRILKLLKQGAKPMPIYVEANDPDLFVMEGRHRMVAFWLAGMKTIPVAYVSVKTNENFADGKVKGKSRPGRVKKSGASCNGSVTDLRKRAKNASGEKAKMYHWCANMKSGRKKGK